MSAQIFRISDTGSQGNRIGILRRLYDADYLQIFAVLHQFFHIFIVVRLVGPDLVLAVILIIVCAVHHLKRGSEDVFIRVASYMIRCVHLFLVNELLDHFVQFHRVPQTKGIQHEVTDSAAGSQYYHTFIIIFRPAACHHLILVFVKTFIFRHFVENIRTHHGGHHAVGAAAGAKPKGGKGLIRIHLADTVSVFTVNLRHRVIGILDRTDILVNSAVSMIQILLQGFQVIGIHGGKHIRHHLDNIDISGLLLCFPGSAGRHHHRRRKIESGTLDLQRIFRQRLFLHRMNIGIHSGGQRQD